MCTLSSCCKMNRYISRNKKQGDDFGDCHLLGIIRTSAEPIVAASRACNALLTPVFLLTVATCSRYATRFSEIFRQTLYMSKKLQKPRKT